MHAPDRRHRAHPLLIAGKGRRVLRSRWDVLLVISVGGVLGSLARWGVSQLIPHRPGELPWATVVVNVTGCLLIGVLMVLVVEVWPPSRYARPFLGTGVLGGFTTFSTYTLDIRTLLVAGEPARAGLVLFGSLLAGFAGVWVGAAAARLAVTRTSRRS